MAEEEAIEVRFRLFDGTDIGPDKYDPSTTVASLKETIIARWPEDKANAPTKVEDLKLINAGRILENKWTLTESRVPVGDLPGSIITMHVVVRPPSSVKRAACYILQQKFFCSLLPHSKFYISPCCSISLFNLFALLFVACRLLSL